MRYLSVAEAAEKWDVSERSVCNQKEFLIVLMVQWDKGF